MTFYEFSWDNAKNHSNQRKHGVSFETALNVFEDPLRVTVQDRIENGEVRWQTVGMVQGHMLVLVAHTIVDAALEGQEIEIIRIISARRAKKPERRWYETHDG